MALGVPGIVFATVVIIAVVAPLATAQHPPTAHKTIENDRLARAIEFKTGKSVAASSKWGFFGTIFHLILEQMNDTKSAYNQISDLVISQFADENAPTTVTPVVINGTTETPKITREEFLKILDRNLKGLNRLRNLEWREAKKDSTANLRAYMDEIFRSKKNKFRR